MLIRSSTPDDRVAIRRVIVEAFTASDFGHNGEAEIVEQLQENCEDLLSLVAMDGDEIVGHLLFSPVTVKTDCGVAQGMGLAPMAVAPHRQQTGVGTCLVESGLTQLSAAGCPFVVVLGHPHYYSRFGFRLATDCGITHGFAGIPRDVFLIKVLDHATVESIADGTARYRPEFGPQGGD